MLKYGIIPDTDIKFKVGDVVEVYATVDNECDYNVFGTIREIDDALLDFRGYYGLYLNDMDTYYRSSEVKAWYRKNRKGVLVKYCDEKLEYQIYQEKHKNDPPNPIIEKIKADLAQRVEKVFSEEAPKTAGKVKIAKFEMPGLEFGGTKMMFTNNTSKNAKNVKKSQKTKK